MIYFLRSQSFGAMEIKVIFAMFSTDYLNKFWLHCLQKLNYEPTNIALNILKQEFSSATKKLALKIFHYDIKILFIYSTLNQHIFLFVKLNIFTEWDYS